MKAKKQVTPLKDAGSEGTKLTNLIYITEGKLTVERHKKGKGFYYTKDEKIITKKSEIERFESLHVPPAWKNVKFTHLKNGHLQAVGLDSKNRKVYNYHDDWMRLRNQSKFLKMVAFGNKIPAIRKKVEKDLKQPDMNQKKVLALIIRLLEETHIRIGNQYYARTNESYGLSTFRSKHVKNSKNSITFSFVGKKGKKHNVSLGDKKLIKHINQCEEIPGWELFKYYDEDGTVQTVDSSMVNEYIQETSGEQFTAKNFRTWSASKIFFETLSQLEYSKTQTQNKKNLIEAIDITAETLGNTRNVCEKYYIHPYITECYKNGGIQKYFKKLEQNRFKNSKYFSKTEKVMLQLINDFEPGSDK